MACCVSTWRVVRFQLLCLSCAQDRQVAPASFGCFGCTRACGHRGPYKYMRTHTRTCRHPYLLSHIHAFTRSGIHVACLHPCQHLLASLCLFVGVTFVHFTVGIVRSVYMCTYRCACSHCCLSRQCLPMTRSASTRLRGFGNK